jgi:hypothetical protein
MEKKEKKAEKQRVVSGKWREKLADRKEMVKYLETAERYWYSDDWAGSEKRKSPA